MDDEFDEWQEAEVLPQIIPETTSPSANPPIQQQASQQQQIINVNDSQHHVENTNNAAQLTNAQSLINLETINIDNNNHSKQQVNQTPQVKAQSEDFNIFANDSQSKSNKYASLQILHIDNEDPFKQSAQSKSLPFFDLDLLTQPPIDSTVLEVSQKIQQDTQDNYQNYKGQNQNTKTMKLQQQLHAHNNESEHIVSNQGKQVQQAQQDEWEWEAAVPTTEHVHHHAQNQQEYTNNSVNIGFQQKHILNNNHKQALGQQQNRVNLQSQIQPRQEQFTSFSHQKGEPNHVNVVANDDNDEFGEYQQQTAQQHTQASASHSRNPSTPISEQMLQRIATFLNCLPDYTFIRANHFITS